MLTFGRSNCSAPLVALAGLALVLLACGGAGSSTTGGNVHLTISEPFDNRATEAELWNAGTISADGVLPAAKLDTMDMGTIYDGNDLGTWSASTQQQVGDFEGECNGSSDCRPCTANYGGSWPIASVDVTVQERGNGHYVIDLWLGSDNPPKTGGCDPTTNSPYIWAAHLTVLLTGIGSATPTGTVTSWRLGAGSDNSGPGAYTVSVTD